MIDAVVHISFAVFDIYHSRKQRKEKAERERAFRWDVQNKFAPEDIRHQDFVITTLEDMFDWSPPRAIQSAPFIFWEKDYKNPKEPLYWKQYSEEQRREYATKVARAQELFKYHKKRMHEWHTRWLKEQGLYFGDVVAEPVHD